MSIRLAARAAQVAIGVWLMVAPAVLDYGGTPADLDRLLGPIIGGLAFVSAWAVIAMVRWWTVPFGVAVLAAPLVAEYPTDATVNSAVCGALVVVLAAVGGAPDEAFGGGWSALWRGRRRAAPPEHPAAAHQT